MATVAERIRQLRIERNLTQTELGLLLDQTKVSVSMWERGVRSPGRVKMEHLADIFNVDLDYMYGRTDVRLANPVLAPAPTPVESISPLARQYGDLLTSRPDLRMVLDVMKDLREEDVLALLTFIRSYRVN